MEGGGGSARVGRDKRRGKGPEEAAAPADSGKSKKFVSIAGPDPAFPARAARPGLARPSPAAGASLPAAPEEVPGPGVRVRRVPRGRRLCPCPPGTDFALSQPRAVAPRAASCPGWGGRGDFPGSSAPAAQAGSRSRRRGKRSPGPGSQCRPAHLSPGWRERVFMAGAQPAGRARPAFEQRPTC